MGYQGCYGSGGTIVIFIRLLCVVVCYCLLLCVMVVLERIQSKRSVFEVCSIFIGIGCVSWYSLLQLYSHSHCCDGGFCILIMVFPTFRNPNKHISGILFVGFV